VKAASAVASWGSLGGMYPLSQLSKPPPPLSCRPPIQLKQADALLHCV
jgi:hypothetical protein